MRLTGSEADGLVCEIMQESKILWEYPIFCENSTYIFMKMSKVVKLLVYESDFFKGWNKNFPPKSFEIFHFPRQNLGNHSDKEVFYFENCTFCFLSESWIYAALLQKFEFPAFSILSFLIAKISSDHRILFMQILPLLFLQTI